MSTYFIKDTKEAIEYCKELVKSVRVTKPFPTWRTRGTEQVYLVHLYGDSNHQDHIDSVYMSRRTLKGFLRHKGKLTIPQLEDLIYYTYCKVGANDMIINEIVVDWKAIRQLRK